MFLATHLLKQWPRTSAALGFGAAGTALSILYRSTLITERQGMCEVWVARSPSCARPSSPRCGGPLSIDPRMTRDQWVLILICALAATSARSQFRPTGGCRRRRGSSRSETARLWGHDHEGDTPDLFGRPATAGGQSREAPRCRQAGRISYATWRESEASREHDSRADFAEIFG